MENKKILVIAPHADDEVLGVGGYLLHEKAHGAEIMLVIGTIGGTDIRQNYDVRMAEFNAVCERLGARGEVLFKNMDTLMDTLPAFEITSRLDKIVDSFRPDEIFINYRSLHQDHIKLYECALASMRLREGYSPRLVALYEYPFATTQVGPIGGGYMYHDISDCIEEKVALFELYATQIRATPSPLNREGVLALARIRGVECGTEYAEKFYVQKMML
ncbi:MAG: PIG-L family deacetylase [Muribaculaceae bacterium]|nr:PIG-L family deacetylase [Muribaculaceae bacterium]